MKPPTWQPEIGERYGDWLGTATESSIVVWDYVPQAQINQRARYFATVALATAATDLLDGELVITEGYTFAGDGGANQYTNHVAGQSAQTEDGGFVIFGADGNSWLEANSKAVTNAIQWGAVADNTTNCFDAMKNATVALASQGGGRLVVPSGTYAVVTPAWSSPSSTLVLDDNVEVDLTTAVINQTSLVDDKYILFQVTGDDSKLTGGELNCSRAIVDGTSRDAIKINGALRATVENVTVLSAGNDCLNAGAGLVEQLTVRDCHFENAGRNCISLTNVVDGLIENCLLRGANGVSPQTGIDFEPNAGDQVRRIRFVNNVVEGNVSHGIYVHDGAGDCSHIEVLGNTVRDNDGFGIFVSGVENTIVSNNDVENTADGQSGIWLTLAPDSTVTGNVVKSTGTGGNGIVSYGCRRFTISNNSVYCKDGASTGATGLNIRDSGATRPEVGTITGNAIEVDLDGIICDELRYSTVAGNTIVCGGDGIVFLDADSNTITGNNCDQATGDGITMDSSSTGNVVVGNNGNVVDGQGANKVHYITRSEWGANAVPTSGSYTAGDRVYDYSASAAGKIGWVCTATGTPGTWKPFGAIDA